MNKNTHQNIKVHIEGFIDSLIERYQQTSPGVLLEKSFGSPGKFAPFHRALIPPSLIRVKEIFRGLDTSLGGVFEECARLIALERCRDTIRGYDVTGMIAPNVQRRIENIVNELAEGLKEPDYITEVQDVLDAVSVSTGGRVRREIRIDLYVPKLHGVDTYFDIKTPKPNKDMAEKNVLVRTKLDSGQIITRMSIVTQGGRSPT